MAARNWTPEQRARQAEQIRQWQPWNKSTGARTAEGKAVSSRNAFKGGLRLHIRAMVKSMNVVLREQREGLGQF